MTILADSDTQIDDLNLGNDFDSDGADEYLASLDHPADADGKMSAAKGLIKIGRSSYTFGVDTDGGLYACPKSGHVVRTLKGEQGSFRQELAAEYFKRTGRTASQNALSEAMQVLSFECRQATPRTVSLRVARPNEDELYIDLGDTDERVVHVTADGWQVLHRWANIPVLFRRTTLTAALPVPDESGDLEHLWEFVNVRNPNDRQVLRGWLVGAALLVGRPCPILALLGEQGTAKTSAMRTVTALFDPTTAPVRRPPNDADKLLHATHGSRVTAFDNLSSIPHWMSDTLCRIVTGESDADRALFTDGDLRVIKVQGVVSFTGIDVGAIAGDLAERCVWANLEVIPASERRSERQLASAWDQKYASMVGGLLDLVVEALRAMPAVTLTEMPRMADFAEILAAIDIATGSRGLDYYRASQESVAAEVVDTDPFLVVLAAEIKNRWEVSGKALHKLLPAPDGDKKYWPTPRGMNGKLKRVAPDLRKVGWTIVEQKADPQSKRGSTWIIEPPTSATPVLTAAPADPEHNPASDPDETARIAERIRAFNESSAEPALAPAPAPRGAAVFDHLDDGDAFGNPLAER